MPAPSAFLYATDENASQRAPARPPGRLDSERSSGAVALTAALLSAKYSSGTYAASSNGLHEPRTSGADGARPQDASARETHAPKHLSALRDGSTVGVHGQLRDARLSSTSENHSEERAALLALRPNESCGGKTKQAQPACASKAGSGGGGSNTWWTQSWAVRLCADCARRAPPAVQAWSCCRY